MPSITVRNVPEEVNRAIRVRAAMHGRSAQAELREILWQAAKPEGRLKFGSLLVSIAQQAGGLDDTEVDAINNLRDKTPAKPLTFE